MVNLEKKIIIRPYWALVKFYIFFFKSGITELENEMEPGKIISFEGWKIFFSSRETKCNEKEKKTPELGVEAVENWAMLKGESTFSRRDNEGIFFTFCNKDSCIDRDQLFLVCERKVNLGIEATNELSSVTKKDCVDDRVEW